MIKRTNYFTVRKDNDVLFLYVEYDKTFEQWNLYGVLGEHLLFGGNTWFMGQNLIPNPTKFNPLCGYEERPGSRKMKPICSNVLEKPYLIYTSQLPFIVRGNVSGFRCTRSGGSIGVEQTNTMLGGIFVNKFYDRGLECLISTIIQLSYKPPKSDKKSGKNAINLGSKRTRKGMTVKDEEIQIQSVKEVRINEEENKIPINHFNERYVSLINDQLGFDLNDSKLNKCEFNYDRVDRIIETISKNSYSIVRETFDNNKCVSKVAEDTAISFANLFIENDELAGEIYRNVKKQTVDIIKHFSSLPKLKIFSNCGSGPRFTMNDELDRYVKGEEGRKFMTSQQLKDMYENSEMSYSKRNRLSRAVKSKDTTRLRNFKKGLLSQSSLNSFETNDTSNSILIPERTQLTTPVNNLNRFEGVSPEEYFIFKRRGFR